MSAVSLARYYVQVPRIWLQLTAHNTWGILNVLDIIWLRPMPGGIIDDQHPFCTGMAHAECAPRCEARNSPTNIFRMLSNSP